MKKISMLLLILICIHMVMLIHVACAESAICTANQVNLRMEPKTNSRSIGQLSKGETLTVLEPSGEWTRVRCAIGEGYIKTQYVEYSEIREDLYVYQTIGNTVTFGSYEQDNDMSNGPEPIEWTVYDTIGTSSFLICNDLLDVAAFHHERTGTWGQSDLRKWLNKDFIGTAFTDEERVAIQTTSVRNGKDQGDSRYQSVSGNNTNDQIFLLSYAEMMKYLPEKEQRTVVPTAYALARGAKTTSGDIGNWWLRSPGKDKKSALVVARFGTTAYADVRQTGECIRPAMWIDIRFLK